MSNLYFGEREKGLKPRTENEIDSNVWGGLLVVINSLIEQDYFGSKYPKMCPDNDDGVLGTNEDNMKLDILAFFPDIKFPLDASDRLSTLTILELLEFCHERIAKPIPGYYHKYYGKHHLSFDVEAGQLEFRSQVNRIFARNGIAFELQENGLITRLIPPVLSDYLNYAVFQTGDIYLDSMLEKAREEYLNTNFQVRLEALKKLWDAWERIKTLEDPTPKSKLKSIKILLEKASDEPKMRERLNIEADELTYIGNNFMIRHTEMDRTPITSSAHADYLFHRLFALIYLLLGNRIGKKLEDTKNKESTKAKPMEEEMQF